MNNRTFLFSFPLKIFSFIISNMIFPEQECQILKCLQGEDITSRIQSFIDMVGTCVAFLYRKP